MLRKGNKIYFDEETKKGVFKYSFYIDVDRKEVVFSEDCKTFLDSIKECILGKSKGNLATLNIYYKKDEFKDIFCSRMLKLGKGNRLMDTIYFTVPSGLKVSDVSRSCTYSKLSFLIERNLEGYLIA